MNPQTDQYNGAGMAQPATVADSGLPLSPSQALNPSAPPPFGAAQPASGLAVVHGAPGGLAPNQVQGAYPAPQQPMQTPSVPASEPPMLIAPPVLQPTVPVHPVDTQAVQEQSVIPEVPEEAADIDVIEKEWVLKTKEVIEMTRGNPYKQSMEINKLRAEYMKKRYNKDIKLVDM
jgi:hypothetical protein